MAALSVLARACGVPLPPGLESLIKENEVVVDTEEVRRCCGACDGVVAGPQSAYQEDALTHGCGDRVPSACRTPEILSRLWWRGRCGVSSSAGTGASHGQWWMLRAPTS